jgi:tRNA uracil 4-sulfurtransferase
VKEYCAIAPGNPVTSARPEATREEERQMDLRVLERATAARRVVDLHSVSAADLVESYLFTEVVPDSAVVIDVRSDEEWEEWHYEGAVHRDFWELSAHPDALDRDRVYVLYCGASVQSAQLAEKMQRIGMEAYAFRGGTRALRRLDASDREGS